MSLERVTDSHVLQPTGNAQLGVRQPDPADSSGGGDIYRGEPPPPPRPFRSSSPASDRPGSSSSSSSFSGRLGPIAAFVELAISRWARGKGRSSDTSSTSSKSSVPTQARSRATRRRRRRISSSNLKSVRSERNIRARIEARQEFRLVPREFTLYLPSDSTPLPTPDGGVASSTRVSRTTSRSQVLNKLEAALRTSIKARKDNGHLHTFEHHNGLSEHPSTPRKSRKGKERDVKVDAPQGTNGSQNNTIPAVAKKAWWLDVAGPTWDDLGAIGKLLHLHPLTLEDILQRESREKLEVFTSLGYYFVVFRAPEAKTAREKIRKQIALINGLHGSQDDLGIVDEALIYLIVFKEGICSFHFTDVSDYTDHVRNRALRLEDGNITSSDGIAYGILDAAVDSFFPFLGEVGHEIAELEDLVFGPSRPQSLLAGHENGLSSEGTLHVSSARESIQLSRDKEKLQIEKVELEKVSEEKPPVDAGAPTPKASALLHWLRRSLSEYLRNTPITLFPRKVEKPALSTMSALHRISRTRRLVTSLARLLATKSEVISRMRKRPSTRRGHDEGDSEIEVDLGSVQDHILSLQMSLHHYERILTQLYPAYLAQLNITLTRSKTVIDDLVFRLTLISIACGCVQPLTAIFSMNVTIPSNTRNPSGAYTWFGIVIVLSTLDIFGFLLLVRSWWRQAARRRRRVY